MNKTILPQISPIGLSKASLMSSNTYRMHIEENHVEGAITSDIEAVKQACYKIMNTERYDYIIYSSNYGIELKNLFGKPIYYVIPILPERIKDALMQDDRITDVDDFNVYEDTKRRGVVVASFTVHSIYGSFNVKKEVTTA